MERQDGEMGKAPEWIQFPGEVALLLTLNQELSKKPRRSCCVALDFRFGTRASGPKGEWDEQGSKCPTHVVSMEEAARSAGSTRSSGLLSNS